MINFNIIKATSIDVEMLQKISKQTFFEAFADDNSEENIQKYLISEFSIEKLKKELNSKNTEFYFAFYNQKVIGYLKLNFENSQTELKFTNTTEIERIYVLKEFYGKGVGNLLLKKSIEMAHRQKTNFIWLGVWEKNFRAIRFYEKNGFKQFDYHVFKLGDDLQTDFLMKLQMV